ncbi:hypothetical protein NEIRO03_0602 [Nematocida sp. AWRm78]|nr:hypothetical protein NEIRO02_0533 [Nematocida sp. AWRm79]KAI5182967.1 hypothetical protein NEIRO03_0602 [Nematocida sp. AWRm78]
MNKPYLIIYLSLLLIVQCTNYIKYNTLCNKQCKECGSKIPRYITQPVKSNNQSNILYTMSTKYINNKIKRKRKEIQDKNFKEAEERRDYQKQQDIIRKRMKELEREMKALNIKQMKISRELAKESYNKKRYPYNIPRPGSVIYNEQINSLNTTENKPKYNTQCVKNKSTF